MGDLRQVILGVVLLVILSGVLLGVSPVLLFSFLSLYL